MANIFVSYSRNDIERVRPLVELFKEQGWSVWWDPEIEPGAYFDQKIRREIDQSACVVVVWSAASVTSRWVLSEAEAGANKLVPVRIDAVTLPLGLDRIQAASLTDWRIGESHAAIGQVLDAIARRIDKRPPSRLQTAKPRVGIDVLRIGSSPHGIAIGGGTVWVADDVGVVYQVDPKTLEIRAQIAVNNPADGSDSGRARYVRGLPGIAYGFERAWVVSDVSGRLLEIEARTATVKSELDLRPYLRERAWLGAIAIAFGSVWLTTGGGMSVLRVDPGMLRFCDRAGSQFGQFSDRCRQSLGLWWFSVSDASHRPDKGRLECLECRR